MKKFLKLMIGLLLLPLCWAGSHSVYLLLTMTPEHSNPWALPVGFLLSVTAFFLLPHAFRTYVFGHEMTHALTGLLMGARVGKMKIGQNGGHVELSKGNFIISLSPYFFPFYTGVMIALWYIARLFADVSSYEPVWLGAVGFTWGFHVIFTVYMLTQHQPDVQENGRVFSYAVIYIANLLTVALWIILIGKPEFQDAWDILLPEVSGAYGSVWSLILAGWSAFQPVIKKLSL